MEFLGTEEKITDSCQSYDIIKLVVKKVLLVLVE